MVREVALTDSKETLDRGLELVVYPNTTHGVVDSGEDLHGLVVGRYVSDLLVHIEEVAVAGSDGVAAKVADSLREVEEYSQTGVVHAESLVAAFLSGTRSHVARHEVTECWIAAFQVVVAVFFGDVRALLGACLQCLGVFNVLRNPDAAVVTQRFRHKGELRLLVAVNRNTSWVNLHVSRVCKVSALAIASHSSRAVASHCVGAEEVGVAVTAGGDNHSVSSKAFEFAGNQVLGNDTASATVNHHHVVHFVAVVALHLAHLNLAVERAVGTEQKLLTGLTLSVECARYLSTTKRAVGKSAAIFASERHTLSHALVDDVVRHFGKTIYVGFASTIVATLHCVVEQTVNRVAVVLIVLGCINTTLCSNRVSTAW